MTPISSRDPLNIRQMQFYAALCPHRYCEHYQIKHSAIDALILHLANLMTATNLPHWEQVGGALLVSGRGDPMPDAILSVIPEALHGRLERLIENCVEVGIADFYAAPSEQPAQFLTRCTLQFQEEGIQLPPLPQQWSSTTCSQEWGEPSGAEEMDTLIQYYGVV